MTLAVGLPEELRVAQPRGHDALGVLRDRPLVARLRVDDRQERFLQLAVVCHHREPVLVVHERRRQHFLRQLEKAAVEEAGHDPGELDEIGDFVDQRGVLLELHSRR